MKMMWCFGFYTETRQQATHGANMICCTIPQQTTSLISMTIMPLPCIHLTLFSIINLPSRLSHSPVMYKDGLKRIMNSKFYCLTKRDSIIIVSNLSDPCCESPG